MSRRWRAPTPVAVSLAATALLALLLAGRRHEFAAAASSAAPRVLSVAMLGQVVALRRSSGTRCLQVATLIWRNGVAAAAAAPAVARPEL